MNEHIKADTIKSDGDGVRATAQSKRRSLLRLSFFLLVVVPSLLVAFYFNVIAADKYAVEVRFAVRGPEGSSSPDLLSLATGVNSPNSTTTDAYILMDYLRSRQLLEDLSKRVDFEAIFNSPKADMLAKFPVKQRSIERFVQHWQSMVSIEFDTTSSIIILELRSFEPEHSKQLAQETLKLSENLINRLSERSRQDALRGANEEVERHEQRLRESLNTMRQFREQAQDIDPSQSAAAQLGRLSELEGRLNLERTTLATQRTFMSDQSPSIQFTLSKIEALEKQVSSERAKLGRGDNTKEPSRGTLSSRVQDYQALTTELEFAQKAYLLSLQSLEQARLTANRQQRYLATFVAPSLPQEALYPQRIINSLIAALLSLAAWFIGVLIVYGVRDHAL